MFSKKKPEKKKKSTEDGFEIVSSKDAKDKSGIGTSSGEAKNGDLAGDGYEVIRTSKPKTP